MNQEITQERAARRYSQMAVLERQIQIRLNEILECKAHLKDLAESYEGLLKRMREAARDEGELPLFDDIG